MANVTETLRFRPALVSLCVALIVLAAACGRESPDTLSPRPSPVPGAAGDGPASPSDQQQIARSRVLQSWKGDLDGMIERRVIRVLTTYSKTGFFIDKGAQYGLVHDAFRVFEDDLNKQLRNKNIRVQVMILPVSHDDLIPALLEGRGDIVAAGTMIPDPRTAKVDFTNPTMTGVSAIPVTGPGAAPVARIEDLAGREVYLRPSMFIPQAVERFNAELVRKGLKPVKIRPAPEVLADEDILEMVNAGLVGTTIAFEHIAVFWQQVLPKLVLNRDAAVKTGGQIAMMVRKNSPQLKAALNAYLASYPEGSAKRNVLLRKYLTGVTFAKQATSAAERVKLERTMALFRKYGDQYSVDYLLMAAQGYQESQLNHNARSRAGAVGVMQLMPATGKAMKVGDIRKLDPNIHAGVKYIRFMMDQYYREAPMGRLDRGLFAFASYNAGPTRINQLRQRAARRGLDPNKWFNNVEVLAAESIGRETVQYVSNIYKYYLAYQMYEEQRALRLKAKQSATGRK